jgi:hypothetical protein
MCGQYDFFSKLWVLSSKASSERVSTWVLGHMEVTDKLGWWMLKVCKTFTQILGLGFISA